MKKGKFLVLVAVLGIGTASLAQVTKPVMTPDPATHVAAADADGSWTCTTTCGGNGAKAAKRKVKEAKENSDRNCSAKGGSVVEAIDHLKGALDRDGDQSVEHAPKYQCESCEKNDLANAVCKNQNTNVSINYKDWAKTKSPPESQKTSP